MAYEFQEYPKYLYHPTLAPKGKIFQSADETKGLESEGWVDTPAKFLPPSRRDLTQLRADFDAAEEQHRYWTSEGTCQPGSNKWEEVTAKYQAARDAYDFGLRHAEISASRTKDVHPAARKAPEKFETPFSIFTLKGVLGEGGTGTVYEVCDEDDVPWAIKCLKPTALTSQRLKRFKNELAFCSKNVHPNIIQVADSGLVEVSGNRVPFYVMPRFPSTLRLLLRAGIDHGEVLHLFEQLLGGLEAAHNLGVWHRDLKPENLLYDPAKHLLVICDFGIAHFADSLLQTAIETAQHDRLANFQYAAPEQRVLGTTDHRSDIYALGLILNEMFTNQLLQGTGHKQIGAVAPKYAYLDVLVDRMVRQSPAERPASIAEIRAALPASVNSFIVATPSGTPEQTSPDARLDSPVIGSAHASDNSSNNDSTNDVFQRLRMYIYRFADSQYPQAFHLDSYGLSKQFGLEVGYVREFLEELHREGYISIAKWDGTRELPLNKWPSSSSFFEHTDDGRYVRVRMRRRGKQQFEQIKSVLTN